jgi:hypothetical protein
MESIIAEIISTKKIAVKKDYIKQSIRIENIKLVFIDITFAQLLNTFINFYKIYIAFNLNIRRDIRVNDWSFSFYDNSNSYGYTCIGVRL